MKKLKKIFMNNLKLLIGIIIGTVVSGLTVYAATLVASSEVSYTLNGQSTVKGALDDLYSKSNSSIDLDNMNVPTNYYFGKKPYGVKKSDSTTPPEGYDVYGWCDGSSDYFEGVCIIRNGSQHCFMINNWTAEKSHLQKVFSDITCTLGDYTVYRCNATDFDCILYGKGDIYCSSKITNKYCSYTNKGELSCG